MNVQIFITCLIDGLFPETGEAVMKMLYRAGCQAEFNRSQTCCGQPAYNAGFWHEARLMAGHTLEILKGSGGAVVLPSGSCTHMIRHGYLELFKDDREMLEHARNLAARTFELTEFLIDRINWSPPAMHGRGPLAYHPSCHLLRGLQIHEQPIQLLERAGFDEIVELSPDCCGFGGIFAIDHAPISNEMLQRRLNEIMALEIEAVVGCDVSCLMNIEGALRRAGSNLRCAHLASILTGADPGLR